MNTVANFSFMPKNRLVTSKQVNYKLQTTWLCVPDVFF